MSREPLRHFRMPMDCAIIDNLTTTCNCRSTALSYGKQTKSRRPIVVRREDALAGNEIVKASDLTVEARSR